MSAIRLCLSDPALRAAGMVMVLQGAVVCSFGPYFSTLAVNTFGFGDRGYAILLAVSSLASVSASVIGGIRADQTANRRKVTLTAVGALLLATLLMTVIPGPWTFVLTLAVLVPISGITFGQVFAQARLAAFRHPAELRDGVMAVQRLAGDATAASCFALGTTLGSYGTVAALGVAASLAGATALRLIDRS